MFHVQGPPPSDAEAKHALLYPFDLSHLPYSESYGAPPNLPTPPHFTTLLSPLADPFFLPPPFTPSDPYFMKLSDVATDKIRRVREEVDKEILEFVTRKRKQVASVQRRARGECEILYKSYEKACRMRGVALRGEEKEQDARSRPSVSQGMEGAAGTRSTSSERPTKESFGEPSVPGSASGLALDVPGRATASRMPIRSSVAQTGYGSSLLSASLSVSYFPQQQGQQQGQQQQQVGIAAPTPSANGNDTTPRPGRSPMKSPQVVDHSFQKVEPIGGLSFNSNPITTPFHRGAKSGVDLDVVSSLRISHMDERFGHGSSVGGGSRAVTSEMHHSLGRKGNRYHNPLDTDLDVEADDPAMRDPSPSKLDRVLEREEDVREGGEGDIALHPFAESSQVSAASSYKDQRSDEDLPVREPERQGSGEKDMPPRGRRPSFMVPEEERTPRPRNVKHLSSSSPETMRRLSNTSSSRRSAMGGAKSGADADQKEEGEASGSTRKKVKFEEAVVVKDDQARSDQEDMQRERAGIDEPEDSGLISGPDGKSVTLTLISCYSADSVPTTSRSDAVFDFEDHDAPRPQMASSFATSLIDDAEASEASSSPARRDKNRTMQENTQLVEKKLIQLMAADAPSHRSAWRNDTQKLWQALGQTTNRSFLSPSTSRRTRDRNDDSSDDEDVDENKTSLFATSMPVRIVMPKESGVPKELEPKTSLVDRKGMLVPPLKNAMRRAGSSDSDNSSIKRAAGDQSGDRQDVSVSASVSNITIGTASMRQDAARSQGRGPPQPSASYRDKGYGGFSVDPGPALEAMGTLSEEEEDEHSAGVKAGAPGFIPPHRQDRTG